MLGEVKMFAGGYAPKGWAFCDGRMMSIAQHVELYNLLGTNYGGDGHTTFGLPDLRSSSPIGIGQGIALPKIERNHQVYRHQLQAAPALEGENFGFTPMQFIIAIEGDVPAK